MASACGEGSLPSLSTGAEPTRSPDNPNVAEPGAPISDPVFVVDPDAQIILDIYVASPVDDSNVVASAKIGPPIVVRFLSPAGTNYEVAGRPGAFGSSVGGVVATPAGLKAAGIDFANVFQWPTANMLPGKYRLELSWIRASAPFQEIGDDHPIAIDLSLTAS